MIIVSIIISRMEGTVMYSKTVMDHFKAPRNVGVIEDAEIVHGRYR